MKKTPLLFVMILIIGFSFTSCKESKKVEEDPREEMLETTASEVEAVKSEEIAMAEYQCPMKCEEDKVYNEASSCPVCKMELKEVAKGEAKEKTD